MRTLSEQHCIPCASGVSPMPIEQANLLLARLKKSWEISSTGKKIRCEFKFKDFSEVMLFVNKTANVAEVEQHHPDIHISYNKVAIEVWTHAIDGLSENDFILAAKIEEYA